jgi:hypothetical protein
MAHHDVETLDCVSVLVIGPVVVAVPALRNAAPPYGQADPR